MELHVSDDDDDAGLALFGDLRVAGVELKAKQRGTQQPIDSFSTSFCGLLKSPHAPEIETRHRQGRLPGPTTTVTAWSDLSLFLSPMHKFLLNSSKQHSFSQTRNYQQSPTRPQISTLSDVTQDLVAHVLAKKKTPGEKPAQQRRGFVTEYFANFNRTSSQPLNDPNDSFGAPSAYKSANSPGGGGF